VRWFRPPYGEQTRRSFIYARRLGLDVVVWNANSRDCYAGTIDTYLTNIEARVAPGTVVLFHDGLSAADPRAPRDEPLPASFNRAELAEHALALVAERGLSVLPFGEVLTHGVAQRAVWLGT
jgi:hypothetical protein